MTSGNTALSFDTDTDRYKAESLRLITQNPLNVMDVLCRCFRGWCETSDYDATINCNTQMWECATNLAVPVRAERVDDGSIRVMDVESTWDDIADIFRRHRLHVTREHFKFHREGRRVTNTGETVYSSNELKFNVVFRPCDDLAVSFLTDD